MIKIRYRDPRELAPGLYAAAECHSRGTTVYLLPGLSAAQRRAALRRLRISARRGCGPQLPAPQLAVALLADRIRTAAGRAGAVFRSHPAASTVPVMVVSAGAIAFLALSGVSIRVIQPPPGSSQPSFAGVAAAGLPASAGAQGDRPRYAELADPGPAGPAGGQPAGSRAGPGLPGASGTVRNETERAGRSGTRPMRAGRPGTRPTRAGRPATGPTRAVAQPRAPSAIRAPAGNPAAERPRPGAPTRPPRRARRRPVPRPRPCPCPVPRPRRRPAHAGWARSSRRLAW